MFINDVVNVGGNIEVTIKELAEVIIDVTQSSSTLKHLPPLPEGDMTRRLPDTTKMDQLLQRPRIKLNEGLKTLLESKAF